MVQLVVSCMVPAALGLSNDLLLFQNSVFAVPLSLRDEHPCKPGDHNFYLVFQKKMFTRYIGKYSISKFHVKIFVIFWRSEVIVEMLKHREQRPFLYCYYKCLFWTKRNFISLRWNGFVNFMKWQTSAQGYYIPPPNIFLTSTRLVAFPFIFMLNFYFCRTRKANW